MVASVVQLNKLCQKCKCVLQQRNFNDGGTKTGERARERESDRERPREGFNPFQFLGSSSGGCLNLFTGPKRVSCDASGKIDFPLSRNPRRQC